MCNTSDQSAENTRTLRPYHTTASCTCTLQAISNAYPADAVAPALAAEALMNLSPWQFYEPGSYTAREVTPAVLQLLKTSLDRDPLQPLASHLLIHLVEASEPGRGHNAAGADTICLSPCTAASILR